MNILLLISTIFISLFISRFNIIIKYIYAFIPNKVIEYQPIILSLFLFIVLNNMLGLIPYSFTTTSHIIVNISMSIIIIVAVTMIGLTKYKLKFFNLFIPKGLPKPISTFNLYY